MSTATPYRLVREQLPPVVAPQLDEAQRSVVAHAGGPLLMLAGPGTGKTTTLVEAVVERVRRGAAPGEVLVLTFSRKAAGELRERIAGRLGRTIADPSAWTFHAWCLALVTAYDEGGSPRLLSGPERLGRISELLAGDAAGEGSAHWPPRFTEALRTAGMAREVANLLDRARERGLDPGDVDRLASLAGRDDWAAAAEFFGEYIDVLGIRGEMDYADLVRRALILLADPAILADVRGRYRAVFVDEYQDTDPAQESLLAALVGRGGDLTVVGDPDQAIYAFRGADVRGILEFRDRFPTLAGERAPVLALGTSRRFGDTIVAASRAVARRIPTPGLPAAAVLAHRRLTSAGVDPGRLEVRLFATATDEFAAVADVLRRAHLEDGISYGRMAVLVRSGVRSVPVARRVLSAAGVPVVTASDDVPVARDPAVTPFLLALAAAADERELTPDAVRTLLVSPLVGATSAQLRRLGRALRRLDADVNGVARDSATLLAEAAREPGDLIGVPDAVARPGTRLSMLLTRARAALVNGGPQDALWQLWEASGLARRWSAASARGGPEGRAADRDLDAMVALFDTVARLEERKPRASVAGLLEELHAQEIPSQGRREGAVAGGDAVRLLTAHRAKGLEWDLVVVSQVQEGVWPDLRRSTSLLEGDRLGDDVGAATPAQLIADERRLFYVAVTRARSRLLVTAVRSPDEDGDRPSRFLEELGIEVPAVVETATGTLSLASLVARLRRALVDPGSSEPLRLAAAGQLARLAAPDANGRPLSAAAHPSSWWGLVDVSPGAHPVRDPDVPVRLSGSAVSAYGQCPLAWFLDREAQARTTSTTSQGFGLILHALARLVATGALPPVATVLSAKLDEVWPRLAFDAEWQAVRERAEAEAAIRRFLNWYAGHADRWVASEAEFAAEVDGVLLRGSIDWVERDDDGNAVIVDFKTGKSLPSAADMSEHAQLGMYQIAVREGALSEQFGGPVALGGAELVQLRQNLKGELPKVQRQAPLDGVGWADELLAATRDGLLAESFPARVHGGCDRCSFRRSCPAQDAGGQVIP
ncbi:MAG: hypothetical protein QOG52_21 [Frankiaceae bacterium]|nr:hypothetical protein [Frankiaceae bacterium]